MKIALCLFGYPKGSTIYAGGAYEQKFKHLFDQVMVHNPDVFIHSWDTSLQQELVELFNPKYFVFQNQLQFEDEISRLKMRRFAGSRGDIFKTLSFFHTRNVSNKLKNQINAGLSDHWFYGNSKNMDSVCNIRDNVIDYLKEGSEYCKTMTSGWFDSSQENQFSNEFLLENKCSTLRKYPEHYCLNNHCLYKWHFKQNNLWRSEVCKFLNQELWTDE